MVRDLLMEHMTEEKATDIAVKLSTGIWTHDYAITVEEAKAIGLPVTSEMPPEVYPLMRLFPQPTRTRPRSSTCRCRTGGRKDPDRSARATAEGRGKRRPRGPAERGAAALGRPALRNAGSR